MVKAGRNSVSTCSNSANKVVASSEVSGNAATGSMRVASQSPCSKARSGKKVTSHKSTGTVAHFPPQSLRRLGWIHLQQLHCTPFRSQLISGKRTSKFLITCWTGQALETVVVQHPRRCCIDVYG